MEVAVGQSGLFLSQNRFPIDRYFPKTCSDIVYAEIRFKQSSSLKLYFLMARTVVDSKPEKVLNVYTE